MNRRMTRILISAIVAFMVVVGVAKAHGQIADVGSIYGNMSIAMSEGSEICSNLDLDIYASSREDRSASLEWSIAVIAAKGITIRNIKIISEYGTRVLDSFDTHPSDGGSTMNRFEVNSEIIHDLRYMDGDCIIKINYMIGDEMKSVSIERSTIERGIEWMWNFCGPLLK